MIIKPYVKDLKKLHDLLEKLYENATSLYQMVAEMRAYINTTYSLTSSIKAKIRECKLHFEEIKRRASMFQKNVSRSMEGISTYIKMFKEFGGRAKPILSWLRFLKPSQSHNLSLLRGL